MFIYDKIDNKIVKLPLKAVIEDGKWKLEKLVFEEDIVDID